MQGQTQNNPLLNQISFDLVKDKVIADKMKEYQEDQKKESEPIIQGGEKKKDDDINFDEVDSEEERIMRREAEKRRGALEKRDKPKKVIAPNDKYGEYKEITEEEFLDTCLKNEKVVCHFYHKDFERCKIMDKHLRAIALEHRETLFVRIDAEKTPFFTYKLNIKVLPTVLLTVNGKEIERIIGFADIGIRDDFPTINLTRKLVRCKMITAKNKSERGQININKKSGDSSEEEED
ncbi:MAG: thioredoxin domain-containing protein [archaeon]|nr:thioredoxin domain-containing protein [archaeon]